MPGNSKSKRKPVKVVQGTRSRELHLPMLNLPPSPLELRRMANKFKLDLNFLITGTNGIKCWNELMFRLNVGYDIFNSFYEHHQDVEEAICDAIVQMRIMYIRSESNGEFGVLVNEVDCIVLALNLIEELIRPLTLAENKAIHLHTQKLANEMMVENMSSLPAEVLTQMVINKAMVATLNEERKEVERKAA